MQLEPEFNWVKARSECTVEKVFRKLAEAVKNDLSELESLDCRLAFRLEYGSCGTEKFFVKKCGSHMIMFEKTDGGGISVAKVPQKGEEICLLNLSLRMNDAGNCIFENVDGASLGPWQVRRKALEETFFGSP